MESDRLKVLISWSGTDWVGRVLGLDECEARAATKVGCLDRLVARAGVMLNQPLVALILEADPPALVGMSEAASILGWDRRKFATYVSRGHLPQPVADLAGGRVWRRADIEAYGHAREKGGRGESDLRGG